MMKASPLQKGFWIVMTVIVQVVTFLIGSRSTIINYGFALIKNVESVENTSKLNAIITFIAGHAGRSKTYS